MGDGGDVVSGYLSEAEIRDTLRDAGIKYFRGKAGFIPGKCLDEGFPFYWYFGGLLSFEYLPKYMQLVLIDNNFLVFFAWHATGGEEFQFFTIERINWIELMDEDSMFWMFIHNFDVSYPTW